MKTTNIHFLFGGIAVIFGAFFLIIPFLEIILIPPILGLIGAIWVFIGLISIIAGWRM